MFFHEDAMPLALRRAIDTELALTGMVLDSPAQERQCAEFFACLAVRSIAPRALRRAGYDALAVDCEKQSDLWKGMPAAASAQHAIGRQYAYSPMPRLAGLAYSASAYASTTSFYAGHEDIAVVTQTGPYCAQALLAGSFCDDEIDVADADWIWDFAAMAINAAATLCRND